MIRKAGGDDLRVVLAIYETAREYMKEHGNPTQWGDDYPAVEMLEADIARGELFVFERDGMIHGAFAFIIGDDPTYRVIEDGAWQNDRPYGAIHRVAGDGKVKGMFHHCANFCKAAISDLKIDTHQDNETMQRAVIKEGFIPCGRIYAEDGTPRIAYQFTGGQAMRRGDVKDETCGGDEPGRVMGAVPDHPGET